MSAPAEFQIDAFFLPSTLGRLFCVYRSPTSAKPTAAVLYVPPFGEEMHKSRRMAALQAAQFAQAGCAVLQVDLLGCGDSDGDFADASWAAWQQCVLAAHTWLSARVDGPVYLWGLRLGATLAVDVSAQLPDIAGLLLWQPVVNGEVFLNQFLRIKLATEMLADGKSQTGTKELKNLLAAGESVEVAGLSLSSQLALGIDPLRLGKLPVNVPVYWFEVALADAELSPASSAVITAWVNTGAQVSAAAVAGEQFWATQEISECKALLDLTTQTLAEILP